MSTSVQIVELEQKVNKEISQHWNGVSVRLNQQLGGAAFSIHQLSSPEMSLHCKTAYSLSYLLRTPVDSVVKDIVHDVVYAFEDCTSLSGYEVDKKRRFFFKTPSTWKNKLLKDCFALNIFERKIAWNKEKTHTVITFTEKMMKTESKIFIEWSGKNSLIREGTEYAFHAIQRGGHQKLYLDFHEHFYVRLDKVESTIFMPRDSTKESVASKQGITRTHLVEQSRDKIVIDFHVFAISQPHPSRQKETHVSKYSRRYTAFLKDGEPCIEEMDIPDEYWMESLTSAYDICKNPLNVAAHHMLDDDSLFENDDVFISSKEQVYVKTQYGWLQLHGGLKNIDDCKTQIDEKLVSICTQVKLAQKLMI